MQENFQTVEEMAFQYGCQLVDYKISILVDVIQFLSNVRIVGFDKDNVFTLLLPESNTILS